LAESVLEFERIEVKRCPLCASERSRHAVFEKVMERAAPLTYLLCRDCGLVFQSRRMSDAAREAFYRTEYRRQIQGQEGPSAKDRWVQARRAEHLLDFTGSRLSGVKAHLDIGSSLGELLLAFHQRYGCEGLGIEPGEAYRRESERRGVAAVADLSDIGPDWQGKFDLATAIHVLEHLPQPVEYLRQVRENWLAPGAYVLVEVPNLFGHACLELAHPLAFSPQTLSSTLEAAGFDVLAVKVHGRPYSRLLKPFVLILAQARSELRPPRRGHSGLRATRARRDIGMLTLRAARFASGVLLRKSQREPWVA
jgi:2-polyprenyl-3-methyl-5-hydroxy-6-metoxy-1,4-benzoquinol methylase